MFKNLSIIFFCLYIISCSTSDSLNKNNKKSEIENPEEIYKLAKTYFDNNNFESADEEFSRLIKLYPLSNEAIQAEIMIGFTYYLKMDYESAINKFEKIIIKYPAHKDLDYIFYMKAMCNYEQITHHGLDGSFNELALKDFNQVIVRFPESQYAKDSKQKIVLVKSNQAAKHMDIGRFYLKEKKYTAALNRFKIVIEDFSMTKFTPEALHRMVEVYYFMGMNEESIKVASTLGHNYPESQWYKFSYKLIKKIEDKQNVFERISNIF